MNEVPERESNPVPESAFGVQPLLIGEHIPDLAVTDIDGQESALSDFISGHRSVIVFYRGGWCPFCSSHLSELSALEEDIYNLGYQLLAISPDQPEYLSQSMEDQNLDYTLLSDSSMEMSRAFGVAFRVDDETVRSLKEAGMDIVERSGHEHHQLPVPGIFIVNSEGKILFQYVNPDYQERISADILLAALHTFNE